MPFIIGIFIRADLWSKFISFLCGRSGKSRVRSCCASLSCIEWRCWSKWRTWVTALMLSFYCVLSLIWLSSLSYTFAEFEPPSFFKTWYVAAFFLFLTTGVTLITLRQHWIHYTRPDLQRYIIRIAFFVLAYGFYSVRTLLFIFIRLFVCLFIYLFILFVLLFACSQLYNHFMHFLMLVIYSSSYSGCL